MAQPIGIILQQWADLGIFFYVLPFLLIFALVFAILQKINILGPRGADGKGEDNRGINAIIALAIALMSLQFDAVPLFFQTIFPKVGIALSIILSAMILVGLFGDFHKRTGTTLIMWTIGGVAFIIILLQTFQDYNWWTGSFWQYNMSAIVAGIIVIILVMVVINSGKSDLVPLPLREYSAPGYRG